MSAPRITYTARCACTDRVSGADEGIMFFGQCWLGLVDAGLNGAVITPLPPAGSPLRRLALEFHQACLNEVAKIGGLARRQDEDALVSSAVGPGDLDDRPGGQAGQGGAGSGADSVDFGGFGFPKESHLNFSMVGLHPPASGEGVAGPVQNEPLGRSGDDREWTASYACRVPVDEARP